jgi:hypothetical protein
LFGGEKYTEPIVAQGPFVMNTQSEIAQAYHDFHAGKFGEIKYNKRAAGFFILHIINQINNFELNVTPICLTSL